MFEIRAISPDEFLPFARTTVHAFGGQPPDEELERERGLFEFDRSLGVFDQGKIVGTGEIFSFELTLPGFTRVPAAGVTWIAVLPTHRRRGILKEIMRRQLTDMRERDESIGILYASEAAIYGRFGYGLTTTEATYEISTRDVELNAEPSGQFELLTKEEARTEFPPIYEDWRRTQPGAVSRSDQYWDFWFKDPERWRNGWSARFYVVHRDESGQTLGYVSYRTKEGDWSEGGPNNALRIGQMMTRVPASRIALWRYCTSVDLVRRVTTESQPVEEPFRWVLANKRALRTKLEDALWLRLVDVETALSARRYMSEDRLVFEVLDDFLPENSGRYVLEGAGEGASSSRTSESADLVLNVTDLAAIFLGGHRLTTLARAGRVEELRPGAALRADLMFGSDPAPFCGTHF